MGLRNSIENLANSSSKMIWDASNVYKVREAIYDRKLEIIKTPLMQEIYNTVFNDVNHPPIGLALSSSGIYARQYDPVSNTYNPMMIEVYKPEYQLDYVLSCAICLIIQDIYKNTYDMPTTTLNELVEELNADTWVVNLNMKKTLIGSVLTPAFDINNINNIPLENLPIEMNDPKAAKYKVFPTISLGLGIFSLLINLIGGAFLGTFIGGGAAIIGLILGGIAAKTVEKKGLTIIGIILCIIGIFFPVISGFSRLFGLF